MIKCNIGDPFGKSRTVYSLLYLYFQEQLAVMIQSPHEDTPENLCYLYLGILCSDTVSDVIVSECQAGAMRR